MIRQTPKIAEQTGWALPILSTTLQTMRQGSVALVFQDGKIVHIERNEVFRPHKGADTAIRTAAEALRLAEQLVRAAANLQYGQMNVKITDGRVVQVEKTEKRRVNDQIGLYGDGI